MSPGGRRLPPAWDWCRRRRRPARSASTRRTFPTAGGGRWSVHRRGPRRPTPQCRSPAIRRPYRRVTRRDGCRRSRGANLRRGGRPPLPGSAGAGYRWGPVRRVAARVPPLARPSPPLAIARYRGEARRDRHAEPGASPVLPRRDSARPTPAFASPPSVRTGTRVHGRSSVHRERPPDRRPGRWRRYR